jgi:hypothetical protein
VASPAVAARARRLPRRRHGPRQDHPGAVAPPRRTQRDQGVEATEPAAGPGLAARQLGGGDRALRADPHVRDCASLGDAGRRGEVARARKALRGGSRDYELRLPPPHPLAGTHLVAFRGPRRGAGDQEPGGQTDPGGQGARGAGTDRAHGHPDREPSRRPVVDFRLHQPESPRLGQGIHRLHQASR